jgi:methyltransferase-like protein 6
MRAKQDLICLPPISRTSKRKNSSEEEPSMSCSGAPPPQAPATAVASFVDASSGNEGSRKRGRSPPGLPYMADYRPYSSGLLQGHRRRHNAEMHKKQWDLYYRNNTVNGYKDRHYILREFHELRAAIDAAADVAVRMHTSDGGDEDEKKRAEDNGSSTSADADAATFSWMEAGCGVGNAMLPVFEQYGHLPQWRALLGFDISTVAIRLLEEKKAAMPPELAAKVHICVLNPSESDVADCTFFQPAAGSSASSKPCAFPDFVSLIFVLCSIPVVSHALVLRRIAGCMKRPGGVLYFRDYAVNDHAEARFQQSNRQLRSGVHDSEGHTDVDANTYERTNGTLSHFFSVEEVRQLFERAGFEVIALDIIDNEVTNRKTGVTFARKFVQGRFRLLA